MSKESKRVIHTHRYGKKIDSRCKKYTKKSFVIRWYLLCARRR